MENVEVKLSEVSGKVDILDDRQQRMHTDFKDLVTALEKNSVAVTDLSKMLANRKGFVAGIITVVTLLGGILAATLSSALDWIK